MCQESWADASPRVRLSSEEHHIGACCPFDCALESASLRAWLIDGGNIWTYVGRVARFPKFDTVSLFAMMSEGVYSQ